MRTKTLLLTAALGAASLATSMAQVYSVNAVGYVNVTINKNVSKPLTDVLLSNPLSVGGNTIPEVIPAIANNTQVLKFNRTTHLFDSPETMIFGTWDPGTLVLNEGDAFFVRWDNLEIAGAQTITFVGEVRQGTRTLPVSGSGTCPAPALLSMFGTPVPQAGGLTAVHGFPGRDQDQVTLWNRATHSYTSPYTVIGGDISSGGFWDPEDPPIEVAAGFYLYSCAPGNVNWTRTFNINTP